MSIQSTPSNIIKKVEDQMRQLKDARDDSKKLVAPLEMKLLNQLIKSDENITPSNQTLKRLNPK
jgi:hypothetical protein